ncbi:MAG: 30S ribosomal protein S6 [Clostridia bacterium]|nr:30S ribosomal protein S6 [Clostridia bacterium]
MTAKYETALIFSVKDGDEAVTALKDKFNELISKNGAIEDVDDWGKRKLAYLIEDEPEGYYVFFNYTAEPTFPAELERIAGITEGVLRVMTIKK